jgi:hypothetical protein
MTSDEILIWLEGEANELRGLLARPDLSVREARDLVEMHLLLFPSALKVAYLEPAHEVELARLRNRFRMALRERMAVMTGADFQHA